MVTTMEVWGDSHMDDIYGTGIGARNALKYELNFRHDVKMLRNKAKAGSVVRDWIEPWAEQKPDELADVLVVSSGFNEAVLVAWGSIKIQAVQDVWGFLIRMAQARGQKVLWIPTNYLYGRAYSEFPATAELATLPGVLGADVLDWSLDDERDLCPDRVHNSYTTSYYLAGDILDKVATYTKDDDETTKEEPEAVQLVSGSAERDSEVPGKGDR